MHLYYNLLYILSGKMLIIHYIKYVNPCIYRYMAEYALWLGCNNIFYFM